MHEMSEEGIFEAIAEEVFENLEWWTMGEEGGLTWGTASMRRFVSVRAWTIIVGASFL